MTTLSSLIATYGYIIVAICIMLESAGLPLPRETALLLAAAAAGTGQLSLPSVIAVAVVAAIVGDAGGIIWATLFGLLGYVFGRNLDAEHRHGQ